MELDKKKRLASEVLNCSRYRVRFDEERLSEIKEAITKKDINALVKDNAIWKINSQGISRGRAKDRHHQQKKGLQRGFGRRKGSKNARNNQKSAWIARIRLQRVFLKSLRDKESLSAQDYHQLYMKAKGGFFRSLKHLKLYVTEQKLFVQKK